MGLSLAFSDMPESGITFSLRKRKKRLPFGERYCEIEIVNEYRREIPKEFSVLLHLLCGRTKL